MKAIKELTVYVEKGCPDCKEALAFLHEFKIPYSSIDIHQKPQAAELVLQTVGKKAVPQFVLDGKWLQPYIPKKGFKREEMIQLFELKDPQKK